MTICVELKKSDDDDKDDGMALVDVERERRKGGRKGEMIPDSGGWAGGCFGVDLCLCRLLLAGGITRIIIRLLQRPRKAQSPTRH